MKYLTIDIETTGLDRDSCQVLEIAAVVDDTADQLPVKELPRFQAFLDHGEVRGNAFALNMNARILEALANRTGAIYEPSVAVTHFGQFVNRHFPKGSSVTVAGKNVAGFDLEFLARLPGWNPRRFSARVIDPAILYWNPLGDDKLPSLPTCLERAGVTGLTLHDATDDCLAVVHLIRGRLDMLKANV